MYVAQSRALQRGRTQKSGLNDPSRMSVWEQFQKQKNGTIKQWGFKEVLILGKNNNFPQFQSYFEAVEL